jgi:hypothetical protein
MGAGTIISMLVMIGCTVASVTPAAVAMAKAPGDAKRQEEKGRLTQFKANKEKTDASHGSAMLRAGADVNKIV